MNYGKNYHPSIFGEVYRSLGDAPYLRWYSQGNIGTAVRWEWKIRELLSRHTIQARSQTVVTATTPGGKVLLLKFNSPTPRQKNAYAQCKRMLLHARISFDEALISDSPTTTNAASYALVLISYADYTEMTAQIGYFNGTLGKPVIIAACGYGWSDYPSQTHVISASADGTQEFLMPNDAVYYTDKAERYCIATLNMTNVTRVIRHSTMENKAHVWIVTGASNNTLFCANYMSSSIGPWILYYIKEWGGLNPLPLAFCAEMDDANIITPGYETSVEGLSDLYDWCKSVDMPMTVGIKTDQLDSEDSRYPVLDATPETAFLRDHQDYFIPIHHDHRYGVWGGAKTNVQLMAMHKERLAVARQYGFAMPLDLWGSVFWPAGAYSDNAISVWRELGIMVARDEGGTDQCVLGADGVTLVSEANRYLLSEPEIMFTNANQFVPYSAKSIADCLSAYNRTLDEYRGLICMKWCMTALGGFSSSDYKAYDSVHTPSMSVIYAHGTNVCQDNPWLMGLQLGDGIRRAFPGTVYYTHLSSVINRSSITRLLGR